MFVREIGSANAYYIDTGLQTITLWNDSTGVWIEKRVMDMDGKAVIEFLVGAISKVAAGKMEIIKE